MSNYYDSAISKEERRYGHYLLVRRSRDDKQEHAYYVVYAHKEEADLKTLVQVAGHRWEIESDFEETKGECGLDHYEVRQWHSGYWHITLSLMAHAVLAVLRIQEKKTPAGLIDLSVSELRKLLSKLMKKTRETVGQFLFWSNWRRRHQYRAQQCHYRRRDNPVLTDQLRL